jgi:hypothetical protein
MNFQRLGAIVVVLIVSAPLCADVLSPKQISELRFASLWPEPVPKQTPHPAVVRVVATDRDGLSLGSGTLVDANDDYGLIITNWHVVRDAVGPIEVVFPDGFHSPARVVRTDREWDLASLLIWKPAVQPVPISTDPPRPGDRLTIAGYGSGNYKMQSGACTQYLAPAPGKPLEIVELAAAARHGDSGGPILNTRGELAGVLFGEGGGRTDGSYGGRVHQFLQLTANDLQKLPSTNLAKSTSQPANNRAPDPAIASANPAARFAGAVLAADGETAAWPESAAEHIASRPAPVSGNSEGANRSAAARQLSISGQPDRQVSANHSVRDSTDHPSGRLQRLWSSWGDEIKSFLAAFGVAALLLQILRLGGSKK